MLSSNRNVALLVVVILVALYSAGVGMLTLLKVTTPWLVLTPWFEVIYGPAITVVSVCVIYGIVYAVGSLAKRCFSTAEKATTDDESNS